MNSDITRIVVEYNGFINKYKIKIVLLTEPDIVLDMDPRDFENFFLQIKDVRSQANLMRFANCKN